MMQITNLDIEIEGLKILPIGNYYDLTCARSTYIQDPHDGGIKITPTIEIDQIDNGYFYITQICKKHILKIKSGDSKCVFDNKGEPLNDTPNPARCHFKFYKVNNNTITDFSNGSQKVIFFDSPYRQLFPHWTEIEYDIEFETWFQYSKSLQLNTDIKPLLRFQWSLYCKAINEENVWAIQTSNNSSIQSIKQSIEFFSPENNYLLPSDLRNLNKTVSDFLNSA